MNQETAFGCSACKQKGYIFISFIFLSTQGAAGSLTTPTSTHAVRGASILDGVCPVVDELDTITESIPVAQSGCILVPVNLAVEREPTITKFIHVADELYIQELVSHAAEGELTTHEFTRAVGSSVWYWVDVVARVDISIGTPRPFPPLTRFRHLEQGLMGRGDMFLLSSLTVLDQRFIVHEVIDNLL